MPTTHTCSKKLADSLLEKHGMDTIPWHDKISPDVGLTRLSLNPTAFLAAPCNRLEKALNENVMILSGDQADQFPFTIEDALAVSWRNVNVVVALLPEFRKAMKELAHIESTRLEVVAIYEMLLKRISKTKLVQETRINPILLLSFAGEAAEDCTFLNRQMIASNLTKLMYEKRETTEFRGVTRVYYEDPEETLRAIFPPHRVLQSLVADMRVQRVRPVFMRRWMCDLGVPTEIVGRTSKGTLAYIADDETDDQFNDSRVFPDSDSDVDEDEDDVMVLI